MAKLKRKFKTLTKGKNHDEVQVEAELVKSMGGGDTNTMSQKENCPRTENRNSPTNMLKQGQCIIGLSKGVTLNLGNYQSARIDCTLTRVVEDNEHVVMDELVNISEMLDEQLDYEAQQMLDRTK